MDRMPITSVCSHIDERQMCYGRIRFCKYLINRCTVQIKVVSLRCSRISRLIGELKIGQKVAHGRRRCAEDSIADLPIHGGTGKLVQFKSQSESLVASIVAKSRLEPWHDKISHFRVQSCPRDHTVLGRRQRTSTSLFSQLKFITFLGPL